MENLKISHGPIVSSEEAVKPFIINCYIQPKTPEDIMFKNWFPQLDGYAIIPIEEYNRLKNEMDEKMH